MRHLSIPRRGQASINPSALCAATSTSGGVTTTRTTDYLLGGLEEVAGGTLAEYYPLPGIGTAVRVSTGSSSLIYLMSDSLDSVSLAVDTQSNITAQQLYGPYGAVRYTSGTMPTAHGYTGQLADATTGLDYYGARYYDPTLGQFAGR